jgi:hypothetical protein
MSPAQPLAKTGNDIERLLLAAGQGERPDAESVRRAARALGLVPRAALVAATLGLALRASKWTSFAAWSSVSVMGVAALVVAAHAGRWIAPAPAPDRGALPAAPAWIAPDPPPAPVATDSAPASIVREEPPAVTPARDARGTARRISVAATDRLRDEARVLDGARALLAGGDASGALVRLGDYDRRFAGGSLREEALLLRIESLVRVGDRSTAASLARRFLTAYPASVHAERVEVVLRELTAPRAP